MILVSIWSAKGEGRVSKDQRAGNHGRYKESMPIYESAALMVILRRRGCCESVTVDLAGRTPTCNRRQYYDMGSVLPLGAWM